MEDFIDDDFPEPLLRQIRSTQERRKSLVASNDDIAGTHESTDGEWGEWMCGDCGIFMKEHRDHCLRCGLSRI